MRHYSRRAILKGSEGFTLLEILIALVVLSIGILGYMALQFQSITARVYAKEMNGAMSTGITNIEEMLSHDFNALSGNGIEYVFRDCGGEATETDFMEGRAYKIEWSVAGWDNVTDNPNANLRELKTFAALIRWKEKGMEYTSRLITFERGHKTGDVS
jgi:prepilin-type N-terminal cleavage/methylation domain-containing protein